MITDKTTLGEIEQYLTACGLRCTMCAKMGELWWCTLRDHAGIAYEGVSPSMAGAFGDAIDAALRGRRAA